MDKTLNHKSYHRRHGYVSAHTFVGVRLHHVKADEHHELQRQNGKSPPEQRALLRSSYILGPGDRIEIELLTTGN